MQEDELPLNVREKVRKLRRKGDKYQGIVDRLLEKRAAGSPAERRQVDDMLDSLAKPSSVGWWLALVGLVVVAVVTNHLVSQHRQEEAVAAGTPVVAQVKRLDPGDCFMGQKGFKCLRLTLELHPEGSDSYAAALTQEIDLQWMSRVQPGNWLTVSVDRDDRTQVYFDDRAMAVPPPQPPSQATDQR